MKKNANCPRCDIAWSFVSEAYKKCFVCGMTCANESTFLLDISSGIICWERNFNGCAFRVKANHKIICLPRLSFKITTEELNKYLVLA